jgi:hypothetical protein
MGNTREEVALSGIADALAWRHALEMPDGPDFVPLGRRIVVYPEFLDKLGPIFETGDLSLDPVESRRPAYEAILTQSISWPVTSRPIMLPAGDQRLSLWLPGDWNVFGWMLDARRIAVSGYWQVLEDGPDVCDSESDAEYSDDGEQWSYAEMYTPEMIGPDSKTLSGSVVLTSRGHQASPEPESGGLTPEQQRRHLRLAQRIKQRLRRDRRKSRRAGGLATVEAPG